ncbi:3-oxoacyl-ACP reductase [Thermocladium modestius]|uniref:3-oxoacyl-ACP reductase n=1 Tax=Thermocladium modestius TaxID=62609 RepID=A0A830GU70_9CREN|nr:SDR family oxidoreductase [Thermocladium modestius]GGP19591.1 3-oxoacyl-ACP reductase [Thermocladium modestius]
MGINGKQIVITGGANGIGAETAKLFSSMGAKVLILDKDDAAAIGLTRRYGIDFMHVDLADSNQVQKISTDIEKMDVDVLINNASRNSRFSVIDTELDEWNYMIALNLTAPFLLSKAAAKSMIRRGTRGKIINISAIQAIMPLESSFPYATVKGGLISMTKSMAVDLGRYGIQVITVLPGPIYTEGEPPQDLDRRAATALGRMGRAIEVAKLLAFLSSDDNTFMTGNIIVIDGGRLIMRRQDPTEISQGII